MTPSDRNPLKEQVALLPLEPGVYQFLDRTGTVIYVGKAKSLRKRVSSYFMQNKEHPPKVRVLVRQIAEIRHIVVDSETDALLLENSLIKELQPRYNILLKDDKTYPWIVVRRENFPRIQSTRQLQRDGSQYFGPYSSVTMQHSILEFIREVIPLRTCSLNLAPEAIARGRYTVCLQYHLGNCKATCAPCAPTSKGRCAARPRRCSSRRRSVTNRGSLHWRTIRPVRSSSAPASSTSTSSRSSRTTMPPTATSCASATVRSRPSRPCGSRRASIPTARKC